MIKIDSALALSLHKLVAECSGGSAGVRDCDLLDSALNSAFQTFGGEDLYPSIIQKGARLGYSLVSNHAFVDGNKRIGLLIMLTFLQVNGVEVRFTDADLIEIGLSLADGSLGYEDLLDRLEKKRVR